MDSNSTENQINKTLNSWDNLSTPAVNPYLFEKIKGRMEGQTGQQVFKLGSLYWLSACLLFVLTMSNIFLITQPSKTDTLVTVNNTISTEYGFDVSSYTLFQ